MGTIELDERTHAVVRFAARVFDVSEAEVVARAVEAYARDHSGPDRPPRDPWEPVSVYGIYEGRRFDGAYLPATRRLTVTSEPFSGARFKSPSGAARAVVATVNPEREGTPTNGWIFWRLVETDERLDVLR